MRSLNLLVFYCFSSVALKVNFQNALTKLEVGACDESFTGGEAPGWNGAGGGECAASGAEVILEDIYEPGRYMTDAECRTNCKAKWENLLAGGAGSDDFTTGGPFSYENGVQGFSPGLQGNYRSRGCCQSVYFEDAPGKVSRSVTCITQMLGDKATDISTTYGLKVVPWTYTNAFESAAFVMKASCSTSLGGDPHVTNVRGESFDILQDGTFSIVSLLPTSKMPISRNPFLHVDVNIVRLTHKCSEAYIKNATLSGSWITEMGYNLIQIRGTPSVLEVAIDGNWKPASAINSTSFTASSPKMLNIRLREVKINIDIQNYNSKSRDDWQEPLHKLGWSFLNMQFQGLQILNAREDVDVQGLLGNGNHLTAATMPKDCVEFHNGKDESTKFISSLSLA